MIRFPLIVISLLIVAPAFALKGIGYGKDWNLASDGDRNKFVRQTMQLNKGTYPEGKMRTCIDDYYGPKAPSVQMEQDILSTAIRCDAKLKSRK